MVKKRGVAAVLLMVLAVAAVYTFACATPGDLARYPECLNCGMSRKSCSHTRMMVEYSDGTRRAECSLHCVMADLVNQPGRQTKEMLVADYDDKRLSDAEKCWWVRYDNSVQCRGSKVMLAFRSEPGADRFIAAFGGTKLTFDQALKQTYLDIEADKGSGGSHTH